MVLNELEKYQIEVLIERLKILYPNELDELLASELKNKMVNSAQDFMTLSRELSAIFHDESKLENLLLKYGLKTTEKIIEGEKVQPVLTPEDQAKLNFVQLSFPNNRVLASPSKNIFLIKGAPNITVEVIEQDGRYSLRQVEENNSEKVQTNETFKIEKTAERMNETQQDYSIEELKKITEGMTEEEIVDYLRIHGKNQQQIMMILLALEKAKETNKAIEQSESLESSKQLILTYPNKKGKMAAFVDTLYLAFLVGMISGATFFVMLRIILHSL